MAVYNDVEVIGVGDEGWEEKLDRELAKELEGLSVEELWARLRALEKKMGFKPKKREIGADGAILLDPNDPNDREWYENDEDYRS